MFNLYTHKWRLSISSLILVVCLIFSGKAFCQSFSQSAVDFNGFETVNNGTSLMYGPDGRLYITEYTGAVKVYTIERDGPADYKVTGVEVLTGILDIQDHNDDGSLHTSTFRETIGVAVAGTASNPVVYVSSSDFRIGGGGGGDDEGLDTNSGIITRFTWTGSSWEVVDIVRGLPRSEENHATNGLEFTTVNGIDYLIVAQGGHTNAGGPSHNFAYTTEYALSAAILAINLTEINTLPILDDNGRKYIYDLPTLDDPSRPNINGITDPDDSGYDGIDINDPFGGNDGLNQAMIVPGGPVQIFSPGYRNAYDLVVTQNGAVYVTDNGANGGWGGFPVNEGGGSVTNEYDPNEPGSTSPSDGEEVNNKDHLTMVTNDIDTYVFGSFYGGHPTPVRANPNGAGLYTNPSVNSDTQGSIFRSLIYHPTKVENGYTQDPDIGLPANWPPVSQPNPVEGDWRGPELNNPDGPDDEIILTWGTNTNGIDEYTASNFNGAMQGNLLAGVNNGDIRRVELNPDGSLSNFTPSFFSGLGGNALGVSCNGDSEIFPGTIWVVTLEGNLSVMEPQDFGSCIQPGEPDYDALADYDFDGYSNQDEEDNLTDPCNGGSQPQDFDKPAGGPFISDLNDPDDDSDGILDADDPFQLGDFANTGSDAFSLPVVNELFSSNGELKGYLGLGMTGLMNNGQANPNWLNWIDRKDDPNDPNPNDILGGAIGAMTMQMTSGTAYGSTNTQEKGFQYGIQTDVTTGVFTISGGLFNFDAPLQLYGNTAAPAGELGFFIGDGTQSNYIKFVITPDGFVGEQEINDVPGDQISQNITERPSSAANFYFIIDPQTGEVTLQYSLDNGSRSNLGSIVASGTILEAIQQFDKDLAVGFIGTSNAAGVEVEGTWDFLNVTYSTPVLVKEFPDLDRNVGDNGDNIALDEYFLDDQGTENLTYSIVENTNPAISANISGNTLSLSYPGTPAESTITVRATDSDSNFVEDTFTVFLTESPLVLFRVNAGGPAIASIDGELDWEQDDFGNPSAYLTEAGTGSFYSGAIVNYTGDVDQSTTPVSVFDTERYDGSSGSPNLTYSFPVSESGYYEVKLYMGNGYDGTANAGTRIFDVAIEGVIYSGLASIDLSADYGHQTGTMISQVVNITDGNIDISFLHQVQNPLINAIEILNYTGPVDTPIQVSDIPDQVNSLGEDLDGSLVVSASGGDGNLNYSMEGAPPGVSIEPTNGQIGGSIDPAADTSTPYTVVITVDDSDENIDDIQTITFNWNIIGNDPVLQAEIPDLNRIVGDNGDDLDLSDFFLDDQGVENLTFTIQENTDPSISAGITGNILSLIYPNSPAEATITVRATDPDDNFVEDSFTIFLTDPLVLYRINSGGPAITSLDEEIDWSADDFSNPSPYLAEAGTGEIFAGGINTYDNSVDQQTTPLSIFETERYDGASGTPNLTYSFPISNSGNYEVRLYMGNGWDGTAQPGTRIFDISIEDIIYGEFNDLDLSATYGNKTGAMIKRIVYIDDGSIDISFMHGVQNPLINGIEILKYASVDNPISIQAIATHSSYIGEVLDGSLYVSAQGGDGPFSYTMTGAPPGANIDPVTGIVQGTISNSANTNSPYVVTVTVDDNDADSGDTESINFNWVITEEAPSVWTIKDEDKNYTARHECSFVQAGDKFYLIGGRENAQTLDVYDYSSNTWNSLSDSAPQSFNHYQATEYKGLIWVIGAFQTNSFPNEDPADYIWAFDPANEEWIQVIEIPENRRRGSAGLTIYNDKFYIAGGNTIGHNGGFVAWFDEFDPATGTWTSLTDAPRARDHFHAAVIEDKLYLAGGRLSGGTGGTFKPVISEVDVYDFSTNTWSTLPSDQNLPTPRAAAATVNFNGKLMVIGGEVEQEIVYGNLTSDALKITEQYDPATGIWTRLSDLNFERHGTQGIVSGDGVFVLSGSPNKGGGSQKTMEYYGTDNPVGAPSVATILEGPSSIFVGAGSTADINLNLLNGNVGIIVSSMSITGPNSSNFQINSGALASSLLVPGSTHNISIEHLGSEPGETATLTIFYGVNNQLTVDLESNTTSPLVNITTPENGDNFTAPATIGITADASDPNGSVVSVEFFEGSNSLGTDTDSSDGWGIDWTGVQTGIYELTAVATDDEGDSMTSSIITISVGNALPTVAITTPENGDNFTAPATIGITADASDANGSVVSVEFFEGSNFLGTDTDSSDGWGIDWTGVQTGIYELTAVATDDEGDSMTSSIITISVGNALPTVAITTPENGDNFTAPATIGITADASDPNGSVVSVEFFEGSNSLGTDTDSSDGWGIDWTGVQTGIYELTAVATDDEGDSMTSSIITISVGNALPTVAITTPENGDNFTAPATIGITADASDPNGSVVSVEFFEGSNSLGTDTDSSDGWGIDWTGVQTGIYELTAVATDDEGDSMTSSIITISVGNALPTVAITTPENGDNFTAPATIGITADASDANGSVVSVEFFEGSNFLGTDTDSSDGWGIDWTGVQTGIYELTAVATDDEGDSMTSSIITISVGNALPTVAITTPENGDNFTAPATIGITADASDPNGSVVSVEFFEGSNSLGTDTDSSDGWGIDWTGVQTGIYELTAVATDDEGDSMTSSIITISVGNALPTVAITTPENGDNFTAPATIGITADASDANGSVVSVEFFEGSNFLGTDTDSSDGWGIDWTGVQTGIYELTAVATDDEGDSMTSSMITISVGNALPTVAITTPENGDNFTAPATIGITADASDANGSVVSVEFFEGSNSLGTDTEPGDGWGINWTGVQSGVYELTAVATDDEGDSMTSSIITISVGNALPTVAITTPENGDNFTAPATIGITANASDANGSVVSVEFFEGSNFLGTDTDSSDGWGIDWTGVQSGVYELTAVATDDEGDSMTSSMITISVGNALPTVAITTPENGDNFTAPATIGITADASDPNGSVVSVEFFEGSNSLGTDTDSSDGWGIDWTGVQTGIYELTAVATDDEGDSMTSSIITISVGNALPTVAITTPENGDNFTAPATIGITADASDANGSVVSVEFFEGSNSLGTDTDSSDGWGIDWTGVQTGIYELTAVATDDEGDSMTSSIITISVGNALPTVAITTPENGDNFTAPATIGITADASDPNGSVVSVEFFEGSNSLGTDTDSSDGWGIDWTGVQTGIYELTAVATDDEGDSMTSSIITISVGNALPTVAITTPENGDNFTAPATIGITAEASDPNGSVVSVEFFEGSNSLGTDTDSSDGWGIDWTGVQSGVYELTAVAIDNEGDSTTSSIITISVGNALPTVAITTPENGDNFTAPATIGITADASDANGSVVSVEFFEGSNSLGTDTDSSDGWGIDWTGVASGVYELTAVANDNEGDSTTSVMITIQVTEPDENILPVVSITTPENGDNFTAPATIIITANASDADGSVVSVEFLEGSNSLGTDTDGSDGWGIDWTGVQTGIYELTAVATDDEGDSMTSSIITISVGNALPTVAITTPENGDNFTAPATIGITAEASDPNGSVVSVEFFEGSNSLGTDTEPGDGWGINWTGVQSGVYELTAVATDNEGDSTTSVMITIQVTEPDENILPVVSITTPENGDNFTAPATIGITADASDADGSIVSLEFFEGSNSLGTDTDGSDGWGIDWTGVASGVYELTAVATDNEGDSTTSVMITIQVTEPDENILPVVSITTPENGDNFTAPATIGVTADASDANGSVVSVEFFEGSNFLGTDTDSSDGWGIDWTGVQTGIYDLTAVATDNEGDSTTSVMITIQVTEPDDNILPVVSITTPENGDNFTAPATIGIMADASDTDGSIFSVEFFEGSNSLGTDTDSSDGWGIDWTGVASGVYELTAVANDNEGDSTTSVMITIQVTEPDENILPVVSITTPENGDNFTAPATIIITADASDADGSVVSVEFLEGSNSLGTDTDGSDGWGIDWTGVQSGVYEITAVATDDEGASTISEIIIIDVSPVETINAPQNLNAQWISSSEVYLTWNDFNDSEDGFILERSTNPVFTSQVTTISIPANASSYTDRNLNSANDAELFYRIRAFKADLFSEYSNIASALLYPGAVPITRDESDPILTEEGLMVYPNPSGGESTIRFNLLEDSDYTLNLFDAKGAYLFKITEGMLRGGVEYIYNLQINHLPDGMYLVILNSSSGNKHFNLILRR